MATVALVLWGIVSALNILAALKIYQQAPAFAIGFLLAALLLLAGACLSYFVPVPLTTAAPLLAMGTTFALLTPIAVGMLVLEKITWSHHALRAAMFAAVWTVWLSR